MESMVNALANEPSLIAQARIDPAAFAALYDHYFPRIYNYMRYRVWDAQVADDLTARVFERALADLAAYRPERAPFGAWLFGIARHAVSDHFRRQKRRRWLSLDLLHRVPSPDPPPDELAAHAETCDRLLDAVAALGDRERDLIALKFAAGLTNREIATLTQLSESNVGVILYRAIQRLRRALADEEA